MTDQRTVRQRKRSRIHDFAWGVWPWMNWLLPIVGIFAVGNGGWFLLMLLVMSPILVPILGLLGSLPRFLLRRAGWSTAPAPVTTLLFVQWWAWIIAMITPLGATDSIPIPAIMQELSPRPIAGQFLTSLLAAAGGTAVVCWVVVLILVIVLRRRSDRASTGRGWALVARTTAILLPLLFFALIWLGGEVTAQQRDAAGATPAEVQTEPLSVQAARALERYESVQSQLSQVRGMLADDGWRLFSRGFESRGSWASGIDEYGFDLRFDRELVTGETVDLDAARAELLALGWTEDERGQLVDSYGNTLLFWADEHSVSVWLTSPSWWGDAYDLSDELDRDAADSEDVFARTYAYDEWPAP